MRATSLTVRSSRMITRRRAEGHCDHPATGLVAGVVEGAIGGLRDGPPQRRPGFPQWPPSPRIERARARAGSPWFAAVSPASSARQASASRAMKRSKPRLEAADQRALARLREPGRDPLEVCAQLGRRAYESRSRSPVVVAVGRLPAVHVGDSEFELPSERLVPRTRVHRVEAAGHLPHPVKCNGRGGEWAKDRERDRGVELHPNRHWAGPVMYAPPLSPKAIHRMRARK